MKCPRCATEMQGECPLCHYEHRILLDGKIVANLKVSWVKGFKVVWDMNVMVYDHAKFFLLVFSIVTLGAVLSFVIPQAAFMIVAVNLWVAGMAAREFLGVRRKRMEAA